MRESRGKSVVESMEELLLISGRLVRKLWKGCGENGCWASGSARKLLGERVAGHVVAARVALYAEPSSDKALVESLRIELFVKLVAR